MSNAHAYVVSIEFDHEGESIFGVYGDLDYAKSRAIAENRGDTQHVRLFCGATVEYHATRSPKYRRVPHPTNSTCYSFVKDGWHDWVEVAR